MAKIDRDAVELFKKKAASASIQIVEVKDLQEAMSYALDICEKKDYCQLLLSGCEEKLSEKGAAVCERAAAKVLAAPNLDEKTYSSLSEQGGGKGFTVIRDGLRGHLAGIDVSFTTAKAAIADTASCILESSSEETRIATMVCEVHVVALPKSAIVPSSYDAEDYLNSLMKGGPAYTAFISGPSRTADIERVLTLGVHGPLELHVALMEG